MAWQGDVRAAAVRGVVLALAGWMWLAPAPAVAGGWWSYIDVDDVLRVGEQATAHVDGVLFPTREEAEQGTPFHAYLLQGVDTHRLDEAMSTGEPGDWWTPPATRHHLGPVDVTIVDSNMAEARAQFVVPDVPPGHYQLMFCTAGCRAPLADVIPRLDLTVAPAAGAASLTGLLDRLGQPVVSLAAIVGLVWWLSLPRGPSPVGVAPPP